MSVLSHIWLRIHSSKLRMDVSWDWVQNKDKGGQWEVNRCMVLKDRTLFLDTTRQNCQIQFELDKKH